MGSFLGDLEPAHVVDVHAVAGPDGHELASGREAGRPRGPERGRHVDGSKRFRSAPGHRAVAVDGDRTCLAQGVSGRRRRRERSAGGFVEGCWARLGVGPFVERGESPAGAAIPDRGSRLEGALTGHSLPDQEPGQRDRHNLRVEDRTEHGVALLRRPHPTQLGMITAPPTKSGQSHPRSLTQLRRPSGTAMEWINSGLRAAGFGGPRCCMRGCG
jgi:hypothetical protein